MESSSNMELDKIEKVLHSLDREEYFRFMHRVHFNCPFKTKTLTEMIIDHWNNDDSMKSEEFNEILDQRKAEYIQEARDQRKRDLVRIQEMKSKTGVDPLQLFPKEIWMMMIDELPPKDKYNFRAVHGTFRDLTDDTLIGDMLLPMILGFPVERFWGDQSPTSLQKNPECPLAQYSELRLVSKSLRNAVDHWHEHEIMSQLHCGNKTACPSSVVCINLLDTRDCAKFSRIKDDLNDPNPESSKPQRFFFRALEIITPEQGHHSSFFRPSQDEANDLLKFPGQIDDLLDHIGDQIWYFSFIYEHPCYIYTRSAPEFRARYKQFLGFLSKMKNLKWLKFSINQKESDSRYDCWLPKDLIPPDLDHLLRLDLELKERNRCVLHVYNQLLTAYSSQVKMLNLFGMKSIFKEKNGFVTLDDFPARILLKQLEVLNMDGSTATRPQVDHSNSLWYSYQFEDDHHDDAEDDDDGFNDSKIMESIVNTKFPLTKIDWELDLGKKCIYSIFDVLGNIPTLEKISLSIEDLTIKKDIAFLKLPNLKSFDLKFSKSEDDWNCNWTFFFSLQFLFYAKKLKTLIWFCDMKQSIWEKVREDYHEIERVGEMVNFHWILLKNMGYPEFDDDVRESNVWSVFPWLEAVHLGLVERERNTVKEKVLKTYRRCELDFLKDA